VGVANGAVDLLAASPAAADVAAGLALSADPALHLLRRASFGPTPESLAKVRSMSAAAWIDEQLACDPNVDSDATWSTLAPGFPTISMTAQQVHLAYANNRSVPYRDIQAATAARQAYSVWQLREVMVEFWSNHFNIHNVDDPDIWCKSTDDREVIRTNALGKFSALLSASAHSPAMLGFLDNAWSVWNNPNENYARELLELHTLGADALYHRSGNSTDPATIAADALAAESDVANATRVLTGWSANFEWQGGLKPKYGDHLFHYRETSHHVGPVSVYGWSHANPTRDPASVAVGESLLDYLAHHDATARNIVTKLCKHFVADDPPSTLVDAALAVYQQTNTDIGQVVKAILTSPEFQAAAGSKWRRPVEYFHSMVRGMGLTYNAAAKTPTTVNNPLTPENEGSVGGASQGAQTMIDRLTDLDQNPFGWHTPDGYPYEPEAWTSPGGQLDRWNSAYLVVVGMKGFTTPTAQALAGGTARPQQAGPLVDALTMRVCGQTFGPAHRQVLLDWLGKAETAVVTDAELDAGSKGKQLLALILSSPYMQLR